MNNVKMDNLLKIAKSYTLTSKSRFIELADRENGWSDGYIADFVNKETYKAKATICGAIKSDQKPEIEKIIPNGNKVANDVEYSLDKNCAVLKNKDLNCYVNPTFIKYFYTNYKTLGYYNFKFILTDSEKPVKVVGGNTLLGLIMPIRV